MLQEPMMEKLTAMRLPSMVEVLKAQEQDPAARELSFLERLGLLVDQQWTWRENQALARRLHAAKLKGASVEDIDYRTSRGLDKSILRALAQKSTWVAQHENIFVLGPTGVGKSFVACALAQKFLRCAPDKFFLTKPNTSRTIELPASLRSENCSPSARNAVRVPFGISVHLRRNPQARSMRTNSSADCGWSRGVLAGQ